jgi:putative membrane protein
MTPDPGRLARAALLLGFAALVAKLFAAGEMPKYMTPALDPLTALAGLVAGLMGVVEVWGARRRPEPHEHGPDPIERALAYFVVALPIALGIAVSPRALGPSSLGGERVGGLLLAAPELWSAEAPPRRADGPAGSENTPLDDVPAILAHLREVGPAAAGRRVRATGLALRSDDLGREEFALLRFVIAHCVADARPLALLVVAGRGAGMPAEGWVEIEGVIEARERDGVRLVTLVADRLRPIAEPANPYLAAF